MWIRNRRRYRPARPVERETEDDERRRRRRRGRGYACCLSSDDDGDRRQQQHRRIDAEARERPRRRRAQARSLLRGPGEGLNPRCIERGLHRASVSRRSVALRPLPGDAPQRCAEQDQPECPGGDETEVEPGERQAAARLDRRRAFARLRTCGPAARATCGPTARRAPAVPPPDEPPAPPDGLSFSSSTAGFSPPVPGLPYAWTAAFFNARSRSAGVYALSSLPLSA